MDPTSILGRLGGLWLIIILANSALAQQILQKPVTISARRQPVSVILNEISTQAKFNFSYNSDLIPEDSLATLNVSGKTVGSTLEMLFPGRFQYKEKGEYLIILAAQRERILYLSGRISDAETRDPVDFVSIYSRELLVSTLSEADGSFRLRIRDGRVPVTLTVSKVGYGDTTLVINQLTKSGIEIAISQKAVDLDPLIVRYSEGESTWLGRLFLNARLRAQSRNIGRFLVSLPYQASLTPGLGTHGRMSGQVVNKFSLNLLGGYSGGVNGVEIAGGFNISKENVQFVQVAGIFNIVSGKVAGVQVAGAYNHILDSLKGVQVSGFNGVVNSRIDGVQVSGFLSRATNELTGIQIAGAISSLKRSGKGAQISGAFNAAGEEFTGLQIAGGANFTRGNMSGLQISGGANIVAEDFAGWQISSINIARNLKGFQLGVINIADSSSGVSLGLLNFIRRSTSNISLNASEIVPFNLSLKMGTHRFYTILSAGINANADQKAYLLGYGFGSEFFPFRKAGFFIELVNNNVFLGTWDDIPFIARFQVSPTWKLSRRLLLFAGPAISAYYKGEKKPGYKNFPLTWYPSIEFSDKLTGWLGWQAGLSWRYGKL